MGMAQPDGAADASERRVVLDFVPSDDPELTCIVCGREGVDLETTVRDGRGSRITMGKHSRCAWRACAAGPAGPAGPAGLR